MHQLSSKQFQDLFRQFESFFAPTCMYIFFKLFQLIVCAWVCIPQWEKPPVEIRPEFRAEFLTRKNSCRGLMQKFARVQLGRRSAMNYIALKQTWTNANRCSFYNSLRLSCKIWPGISNYQSFYNQLNITFYIKYTTFESQIFRLKVWK